jgi:PTH1 family peptidyl-tRNA hydrolase
MTEHAPYLLVGLGNSGREYRANRHNVGFQFVDSLAESRQASFSRVQFSALVTDVRWMESRVFLAKPQTMMNRSGQAVGPLLRYYRIPMDQLVVVYDDLDLPHASLRMRPGGGSGGHHGIESIIEQIGTQDFPRLRIGIGRPPGRMDPVDYVLQDFSQADLDALRIAFHRARECIELLLAEGLEAAMTACNRSEAGPA